MTRFRITILLATVTGALAIAVPSNAAVTKLTGTVGPGFTITLTQSGKKVSSLKAGKYTFAISDKSSIHNFHLTGPGVNVKTSVAAIGQKSFFITLKKGTYKFICDPHPFMKGSFTVG